MGFLVISFLLDFPPKSYMLSFSPLSCYRTCPSHPLLDHSNYTWRRVQVMKLLIMQFSPTSCHFISLWSKYSSQHPGQKFLDWSSVYYPTLVRRFGSSDCRDSVLKSVGRVQTLPKQLISNLSGPSKWRSIIYDSATKLTTLPIAALLS
jgi:hypothetical protein